MTVNQTVVEKTAQDAKSSVDTLHTHDDTIGLVSVLLWGDTDSEKCKRINVLINTT